MSTRMILLKSLAGFCFAIAMLYLGLFISGLLPLFLQKLNVTMIVFYPGPGLLLVLAGLIFTVHKKEWAAAVGVILGTGLWLPIVFSYMAIVIRGTIF